MIDRSNIIKEAIEYRDKLEKKVEGLAQSIVRLQISLDFADNTIKKKDKEIAELKEENARLKFKLDIIEADYEASEIEIEDLKNELNLQTTANKHLLKLYEYGREELATSKQLADKYLECLQEIKEIAELPKPFKDFSEIKTATEVEYDYTAICNELELRLHKVLKLITKAESEEE